MSMEQIRDKNERRGKLVETIKSLVAIEDRSAEQETNLDAAITDEAKLKKEVDALTIALDREAELDESAHRRAGLEDKSADQVRDDDAAKAAAFDKYLRFGMSSLNADEINVISKMQGPAIQGAQTTGTGSSGGYLVPEGFRDALEEAMLSFGGIRSVATVIPTDSGNDLPFPTMNDTGNKGAILAENAQITTQDVAFGQMLLEAYMYTSKLVLVPFQLLQDSAFDLNGMLARWLGERIARIHNEHFTVGTGSSQPNGVVTASTQGVVGATGQTTSIIYDDLVDLEHSVDAAYRSNAHWMMDDVTLKAVKKIKDGNDVPLWIPGLAYKAPDTILQYPYVANNDVPTMAANAKSILFGDFSKYIIRDVTGIQVLRLTERYADYLQVGFLAYARADGDLLDAGTNPIKHYANSAT